MEKKLSDMTLEELWHLFPIRLTPPDPKWAEYYAEKEQRLGALLAHLHPKLSHIGSTAIHGIWAKPIVDILVELDGDDALSAAADLLAGAGFLVMSREKSRISLNYGYTSRGFAEKVYHIHLRKRGDHDEIAFRDHLNAHPEAAKKYEALKLKLWKQYEFDRDGYTEAKTALVRRYTEAARLGGTEKAFRFAERKDAALILRFIRALAEYEKMSDAVVADEALLEEWIFDRRKAEVIFALENGREVGFALFFHNFSTFLGRAGLYLEDLFVLPGSRGKGYGKAILKQLAKIAVERGCGRLEWSCLNWNQPSIDFYRSLGAEPMKDWTVYRVTGDTLTKLAE